MLSAAMTDDNQGDLFFTGSPEQQENIARVHHKIAPTICAYFKQLGLGGEFHVDQLRRYVGRHYPDTAPDSPGRIMRSLRGRKAIDYVVVNRRASLYRVTGVGQ
jgi:hypothetical protein